MKQVSEVTWTGKQIAAAGDSCTHIWQFVCRVYFYLCNLKCVQLVFMHLWIFLYSFVSTFETNLSSQNGITLRIRVKLMPDIRMAQSNHGTREASDALHLVKGPAAVNLETLPENNLWSMLFIFLLTDPRRAEGGHAGQNCSSTPHQEVSVFGARHSNWWSYVCRNQAFNFSLKPLGKAWQQGVPTYSQRGQKQSASVKH